MPARLRPILLRATLTCPACGHRTVETMPTEACLWFHTCAGCGVRLRPKPGDGCVFRSRGGARGPPQQAGMACGG
jgi:hypothetical protein